ncbi:uncharacterized protein DNG_04575 [Cephalotrichum gorgonifer]|uniref:Rhodopsin domain-containing protein n=1 Tax=Cephalotrichum gorgonifer TaxID=2041049 RepID=A0AAE8MZ77_9PEZI|nr:uncharacterized protein DNG_04575 [Cephalotrichum gorgonifer]
MDSYVVSRDVADDTRPHNTLIVHFNAIIWSLTALSGVVLVLRTYCKITRQRGLWWDDHFMTAAWITIAISCVFGSISTTMGFGRHTWDIDMESPDHPKLLLIMNMTGFWSLFGAAWSKTSFAITLLRLTPATKVKWLIWFLIVTVNVGLYLAAIFMWVQCNPPKKVWNPNMEGTCWDGSKIVIYNSWISVWSGLADIVLAIIPWWVLSRAAMHFKEQIGLLICMSLGVFAGCTSIAKIITMRAITGNDMINVVPLNILGIAEAQVTIIAASIPVLRALLRAPNATRAKSYAYGTNHNTVKTNTSQIRREYRDLDGDADNYSTTELTQLEKVIVTTEINQATTQKNGMTDEESWRRF